MAGDRHTRILYW